MSADPGPHLADARLVLLADGELDPRHVEAATLHLRQCAACRARFTQFEASAAQFADAYRHDRDAHESRAGATTRSRDALKAQLAEINSHRHRGPSWVAACAMLAAALLALQFLSDRSRPAETGELHQSDIRPVAYLTPGATRPVAVTDLCARRAEAPRTIPAHVQQAVVRDYRMEYLPAQDYELDYLITPELGGADDRRNLWPERYASELWNARVKDELEELLPTLVCSGTLPLATAQRDLASDWIAAYKKYFRTDRPLHTNPRVPPGLGLRDLPTPRYDFQER